MGGEKGIICVTGGAGYIASWIISRLLQHGYSVRTTIRFDPKFKEDVSHLKNLPEAEHKLEFFDADLCKPNSFDQAIQGCTGVFHIAHPIIFGGEDPENTVIKPALEGALGILNACIKSNTVKKIIYTSSECAATFHGKYLKEIDETVWSDIDFCKKVAGPASSYFISKTMTEKAVLDFPTNQKMDVVSIVPSSVVGPFLTPELPTSFEISLSLIFGSDKEKCRALRQMQFVHVDDVASAHIFLLESDEAKGRYICSAKDTTIHSLASFLSQRFPEYKMPVELLEEMDEEKPDHLSSKKLLDLGFQFKYGLEEMFDEAIQCCKQKGFL